jgi:TRAP-type uncharacterized transport system substrate-binding protein
MAAVYPGSYPAIQKAKSATGVLTDTALLNNDIYLVAAKAFNDDAAYAVVKALWNNIKELGAAHPSMRSWRQSRMVSKAAYIPYHPGAIRFYKEKGLWDKQMDELQAKRLAE